MCDASDYAEGEILGQWKDKKLQVIYYISRTLDDTYTMYASTDKELPLADEPPPNFTGYAMMKFLRDMRHYFLDEPYFYTQCADGLLRICFPNLKVDGIFLSLPWF